MQQLRRNRWKPLWYGLYHDEEKIYQTDDDGNIVYIDIDGVKVPVEVGTRPAGYEIMGRIDTNFSMSGGEAEAVQYGVSTSDYSAKFSSADKSLPIAETTLFWETEPVTDEFNRADGSTSDWRVVKIAPSQNLTMYLLDRQAK